ncbi:hypothetical protein, partial [Burkholderia sp. 9777_1386]|uniref:hypothetical protein n=1 Tax=Burkholderia sp. 9777_1386 TaxID=2751183 RepID=UPI001E3D124B
GFGFLQKPDDLLFRKALLHVRLLLRKRTLLDSSWPCLQGAGQYGSPINPRDTCNVLATLVNIGQVSVAETQRLSRRQKTSKSPCSPRLL